MKNQKTAKPFAASREGIDGYFENDLSKVIQTKLGVFCIWLRKISNINREKRGFSPTEDLFFPYGIKAISMDGEISPHMYFSAEKLQEAKKLGREERLVLLLFLPRIKDPFVGGETFCAGPANSSFFHEFYPERTDFGGRIDVSGPGKEGFVRLKSNYEGQGGLIAIPEDPYLIRRLKVSARTISLERWKETPWGRKEVS